MSSKTIYLLPDYQLTITADSTGSGSYYQLGAANETPVTINNDDVVVLGPFPFIKAYKLDIATAGITYAKAFQNTMGFGANGGKASQQVGNDIVLRVFNDTGSTISAGKVVYFEMDETGTPKIILAQADDPATSPTRLAITGEDILDGEYGFASTKGIVRSVDTSGFAVGDRLYLSAATPGALTATAPARRILVAQVLVADDDDGLLEITVDIEAAANFASLEGVDVAGAVDNDVLQYDAGSGDWKDYTWSGTANQITITFGTDTTTLSLPQDIAAASSPTFAGLTITGTAGIERVVVAGSLYADDSDNTLGFFGATPTTAAAAATALGANLTNNMSNTTTNGDLEDVSTVSGFADAAATERNLSEVLSQLNATKTLASAIRSRLITLGLWT